MIIAVDGTSGSGKSSLCKKLAKHLGFAYLNSGSIYRAFALKCLEQNISSPNKKSVTNIILNNTQINIENVDGEGVIVLDGKVVTQELRTPEVTAVVSKISPIKQLRDYAQKLQHDFAKKCKNVVVEGRDIGSVVFPNADLKIFITAQIDERARRRQKDYLKLGKNLSIDQIKAELEERDREDSTRKISPLTIPDGALILDTTFQNKQESTAELIRQVEQLIKKHS